MPDGRRIHPAPVFLFIDLVDMVVDGFVLQYWNIIVGLWKDCSKSVDTIDFCDSVL